MSQLNEAMDRTNDREQEEEKEKVRQRLLELLDLSQDVYYDRYLQQMLKDLASGKATPAQVSREADRTYRLYQERLQNGTLNSSSRNTVPVEDRQKNSMEFKIGAGFFGIMGAALILAAFVIIGFNFLEGIGQGIFIYGISAAVILLSELLLKKRSDKISHILTGIGISGLYISTVVNYLVLKNMNGLWAMAITLITALFSILLSRKKDSTAIRLITILGCYMVFLPVKEFESELSFLVMTGLLLLINAVSIFLPNQKNGRIISIVHLLVHTVFTCVVTAAVLVHGMNVIYTALFVIASLAIMNLIYFRQKEDSGVCQMAVFSVALGIAVILLVCVGCLEHGETEAGLLLFYKLLTETMALVLAVIFFILWGKDGRRWIQYYFAAAVVLFFNGFSDYRLESTIAFLIFFVLTRLLYKVKETEVLDCIWVVLMFLQGFYMCRTWYVLPFAAVLLLSAFFIKRTIIYHEIVLTVGFLIGILLQFDGNWTLPLRVFVLLLLFLLFNHLSDLKGKEQFPYNITNLSLTGLLCLCTVLNREACYNAAAIVLAAVFILVAFRERYGLAVKNKCLLFAGVMIYMILAAHFKTPFLASILLTALAMLCIGVGFKQKNQACRVGGLCLAVLVYVRSLLLFYASSTMGTLQKAVLFLIEGVLVLMISCLYHIYYERHKKQEAETVEEVQIEEKKSGEVQMEEARPEEKESGEAQMQETQSEARESGETQTQEPEPEGEQSVQGQLEEAGAAEAQQEEI